MVSSMLQQHMFVLSHVEKHLTQGQGHILKMQSLIANGEHQGFDMSEAHIRLAEFLMAQSLREQHREQILAQIDQSHLS